MFRAAVDGAKDLQYVSNEDIAASTLGIGAFRFVLSVQIRFPARSKLVLPRSLCTAFD